MIIVLNYRTFLALCMVVCALNGHKKACRAGFFNSTILNPTMKRVGLLKLQAYFLAPVSSILDLSLRPNIIFSSLRCCSVRSKPSFTLS